MNQLSCTANKVTDFYTIGFKWPKNNDLGKDIQIGKVIQTIQIWIAKISCVL